MQLQKSLNSVFIQLSETLQQLTPQQYVHPSITLFNATIGQHVRHIIELFVELDKGYPGGIVNYDKRERDNRLETDLHFAKALLLQLPLLISKPDKPMLLEADYQENSGEIFSVTTNYYRELVYNLEHTIHHMALIRIGIQDVTSLVLPENFGFAISTIKYNQACVQ